MKRLFLIALMASFVGIGFGQSLGKVNNMSGSRNKVRINLAITDVNKHSDTIALHLDSIQALRVSANANAATVSGSVASDSITALRTTIDLKTSLSDTAVMLDYINTDIALKANAAAPSITGGLSHTATVTEYTTIVTLTATEIVGTDAGDVGHADGAILVAAPGTGFDLEFVSAYLIYDYSTAAYTGGADDAVIQVGVTGTQIAVSSAITGASLLEAAGDKILRLGAISTELVHADNGAISLYGTALTQPGTAAGVLRVHITYRKHTTGL